MSRSAQSSSEAQEGARHRVEDIVFHIERGDVLDILDHPNPDRYAGQRIFIVQRWNHVHLVSRRGRAHGFSENDHPEPEGDEAIPW